ncbi:MAG: ABC transporter ATP-binding protein [Phycisphaeraceae bacterium]|nr:ABC transporter ATP-binding protein [Phycisphaeraceae bacterium]MBX3367847.1 ABC transporter ATP-binding protein [Phycisphaeraceae bacterium]
MHRTEPTISDLPSHIGNTRDWAEARSEGPLLAVEDLVVEFPARGPGRQAHRAIDRVSFQLDRAEALGVVGESGSGKTTLGRAALGLIPATHGRIRLSGHDISKAPPSRLRHLRRSAQIVFQDPGGSLNPRMTVAACVAEPLEIHRVGSRAERRNRALTLLERCGMPADAAERYPHELSGGQRQRVAIARAIALEPSLIVCDEPTSALDVSVQAQILNLLMDLQRERGLAYLFISHDIEVVAHLCTRIAVMREGRIIESGPTDTVLNSPADPYTRALLKAVPSRDFATS